MATFKVSWDQIGNVLRKQPAGKAPSVDIVMHTHGGRRCTSSSHDASCAGKGTFIGCTALKVEGKGIFICLHLN